VLSIKLKMDDNCVIEDIGIGMLKPSANPLRSRAEDIRELADSIKQDGLLQPLIVRPSADKFEVIIGNRRLLACRLLRWQKIQCIIKDVDDRVAYELSLVENVQRRSMTPIDEAKAFEKYVIENGWGSERELGIKLGKSPSYISQRISLLRLPIDIRDMVARGEISTSSAREIVHVSEPNDARLLASMASRESGSSREIKRYVDVFNQVRSPELGLDSDSDQKVLKKSVLILRIALTRISVLCNRLEDDIAKEYLTSRRRILHELVDETIRFSLKRQKFLASPRSRIMRVQAVPNNISER
jgi:ParB family transcriptional regulator, chromosome partitioning protein